MKITNEISQHFLPHSHNITITIGRRKCNRLPILCNSQWIDFYNIKCFFYFIICYLIIIIIYDSRTILNLHNAMQSLESKAAWQHYMGGGTLPQYSIPTVDSKYFQQWQKLIISESIHKLFITGMGPMTIKYLESLHIYRREKSYLEKQHQGMSFQRLALTRTLIM